MKIDAYGPDALTAAYISLRDKRKELKDAYEAEDFKLVAKMEKVEVVLMQKLKALKVDSFKTQSGTVYTVDTVKYSCAKEAWDLFWQ